MRRLAKAFACVSLALFASAAIADAAKDNGFGKTLRWKSPKQMQKFDYSSNDKPILYVFTQPWCGACKGLKEDFKRSAGELLTLSKKFVMVNVGGEDNNLYGADYSPDGGYIPRILFADSKGSLVPSLKNPKGNPKYGYYYVNVAEVKEGMEAASRYFSSDALADNKTEL